MEYYDFTQKRLIGLPRMVWKTEQLGENALLVSEENGRVVICCDSNNHSLKPKYVEEHLWTQNMSNLETDVLQQKTTLAASPAW